MYQKIVEKLRRIWDKSPDVLSDEEVNIIYERLKTLTNVSEAQKQAHIDNINNKFNVTESNGIENIKTEETEIQEDTSICPKCGKELVLRTAKRGSNAGNQFWDARDILSASILRMWSEKFLS